MKDVSAHELAGATPVALAPAEERRLREAVAVPRRPRGRDGRIHSLIGLGLSIGLLAGIVWALAPHSPVAPEVRR